MKTINDYVRSRRICSRLVFGGGYPKFRWMPKLVKWGPNVSLFWLGAELVYFAR